MKISRTYQSNGVNIQSYTFQRAVTSESALRRSHSRAIRSISNAACPVTIGVRELARMGSNGGSNEAGPDHGVLKANKSSHIVGAYCESMVSSCLCISLMPHRCTSIDGQAKRKDHLGVYVPGIWQ